jgi:hypothetical protein
MSDRSLTRSHKIPYNCCSYNRIFVIIYQFESLSSCHDPSNRFNSWHNKLYSPWDIMSRSLFKRIMLPPPSGSKTNPSKKPVSRPTCYLPASCLPYSLILKRKMICSSDFQCSARYCIPENRILPNQCCENLNSTYLPTLLEGPKLQCHSCYAWFQIDILAVNTVSEPLDCGYINT